MSDLSPAENGNLDRSTRVAFGLRQGVLMAVALLLAAFVTSRLRPDEAVARDMTTTPFLWAVVVWFLVVLVNALMFERSRIHELEGPALLAALVVGAIVFVIGLVGFDGGTFARRVTYVLANSVGAIIFWWGAFGLGALITSRLRS